MTDRREYRSLHILGAPIPPECAPTPAPADPLSAGAGLQLTIEGAFA